MAVNFARKGANVALSFKAEEQADAAKTRQLVKQKGRPLAVLLMYSTT